MDNTTQTHRDHIGSQTFTLSERLAAEGEILQAIPQNASQAAQDRWREVQKHPQKFVSELGGAAALGCAIGLITRNPTLIGESLAPVIPIAQRYGGAALLGASVGDPTSKTALPMARTLIDPNTLQETKSEVGRNLGNCLFDYSVTGFAFGAGAAGGKRIDSVMSSAVKLQPLNGLCPAEVGQAPIAKHDPGGSPFNDLILKSEKLKLSELPPTIRLTGHVTEAKHSADIKPGDIAVQHCETKNREAVRFVGQVNVGENKWVNIDLYDRILHHAIHGMNTFHLNEKKPFFYQTVSQQAGREAKPYQDDWQRIQYKLTNGLLVPGNVAQSRLPDRLSLSGDVHVGAQRPLHDAQSVPSGGNIWLKFEELDSSRSPSGEKPTLIIPLVSTGERYFRYHPQEFGRMKYSSVREAEEKAALIKAGLVEREGETLTPKHRKGVFGYAPE